MNIACSLTGRTFGIFCSCSVPASGEASKIDVPHEGGALGVGYIAKNPEYNTAANGKARKVVVFGAESGDKSPDRRSNATVRLPSPLQ
jgi:hypothetical protein